jgi:hypothetical protein
LRGGRREEGDRREEEKSIEEEGERREDGKSIVYNSIVYIIVYNNV